MSHLLRLYLRFARVHIKSRMEYKLSFISLVASVVVMYLVNLLLIWVMLHRFGDINDWNFAQVAFLYSLALLSYGLYAMIFSQMRDVDRLVIRGDFDRFLVRPLNPFFQILANRFDLLTTAHLSFSITVFVVASRVVGIGWNLSKAIFLVLTLFGGILIQASLCVLVATLSFWILKTFSLYEMIVYTPRNFVWYPISIYNRAVQFILTFIIPYAFVNYYPATLFLEKLESTLFSNYFCYLCPLVGLAFFCLVYLFWRFGVNHYQSTGS